MENKNIFLNMLEEKCKEGFIEEENIKDIQSQISILIQDTLEDLKSYEPSDLKFIYVEEVKGIVLDNCESYGKTISEALYNILENYLKLECLQVEFMFITKKDANYVSKLTLLEIEYISE